MITFIFTIGIAIIFLCLARVILIQGFKISYYEQKLRNRDVDISSVESMTLIDVFTLK